MLNLCKLCSKIDTDSYLHINLRFQYMNRILTYILLFFSYISTFSQVIVEQEVSRVDMLIGEQVELKTTVLVDSNQSIIYPNFPNNNYMDGVEVVSQGKIDTTMLNSDKRMQLTRIYKLTSFDSAFYALPPFYVLVDKDTIKAENSIGLKVTSVPVDTTNANDFAGPYTVVTIPFQWSYELWSLIALNILLVGLIIHLYKKVKKNKPITKRIIINPPTPAHQQALTEFAEIQSERPETEDELKVYYDKLTDILRQYIEDRFSFNAKELTSDEIIDKLTETNNETALRELKEILTTADLVKFAKYNASMSETNRSVALALDYVNTTRLSDEQLPKPEVKIVTIGEVKQRNIKIMMLVLIGTLSLIALCLLGYILKDIYDCFL